MTINNSFKIGSDPDHAQVLAMGVSHNSGQELAPST